MRNKMFLSNESKLVLYPWIISGFTLFGHDKICVYSLNKEKYDLERQLISLFYNRCLFNT